MSIALKEIKDRRGKALQQQRRICLPKMSFSTASLVRDATSDALADRNSALPKRGKVFLDEEPDCQTDHDRQFTTHQNFAP